MIIKIMPENDDEKRKIRAVEHKGIKEFFIFGNKKDEDGTLIDFHDWSGGYRYLIGSLSYFKDVVVEQMNTKKMEEERNKSEISMRPPELKLTQNIPSKPPFVKRSGTEDGKIEQVITAEDMTNVIQLQQPPQAMPQNLQAEIIPNHPSVVDIERDAEDVKPAEVDDDDAAGVDK